MGEKRRLFYLILVMLLVAGVTCAVTISMVYQAVLGWQRSTLSGVVRSQADLIVHLNEIHSAQHPELPAEQVKQLVLQEMAENYSTYPAAGETGEVVVGEARDGAVVLLACSCGDASPSAPFTVQNPRFALPLRAALAGKSGTLTGQDYSGRTVLAAYQPVPELGWGVVAKIDMAEIRAPFIKTVTMASVIVLLVIVLLAVWYGQSTNPLIRRIAASERRYRALVESTPTVQWVLDLKADRWTYVAPQVETLLGYAPAEWLNLQWWVERLHPDDQLWAPQYCAAQAALGKFHSYTYRFIAKDGRLVWIQDDVDVELDADGPCTLHGVMIDITERKQAEAEIEGLNEELNAANEELSASNEELSATNEQLRATTEELIASNQELAKSEEETRVANARLETTLATVPDIIMEVDSHRVYTWANKGGLEFFGDDAVGHEAAFYFEGEQETYAKVQPLFMGDENTFYVESWQRRQDGEKRLLAWWCRVLKNARGAVTGALSAASDITERKLAEEAQRESEQFLRAVYDNSPVGISVRDRTGKLLSYNSAWQRIWAIPDEEIAKDIARPRERLWLDDRDSYALPWWEELQRIYTQGGTLTIPEARTHGRRSGVAEWVSQIFYAITNRAGEVERVVVLTQDITERKRTEEALRNEQDRIRTILDTVGNPIFVKDNDHRIILANRAFYDIFGMDETAVIGKTLAEYVPENERQHFLAVDRQVLDTGVPDLREETLTVGNLTHCIVTRKARFIEESGQMFLVGSIHDITERKLAEEALQRLATAVEQAGEAIAITDASGLIRYINPAFTKITGYSSAEAVGQLMRLLTSGKHPPETYSALWRTILSGQIWSGRLINRRKDGVLFDADITISPVRNREQEITEFVMVMRDVSRELQVEHQLRQLHKIEALGTLAGGIAHDFNNILFAILGYAEIIRDEVEPDSPIAENLQQMITAGLRAKELVRQILTFSRRSERQTVDVQVSSIANEVLKLLHATLPSTIEVKLRDDAPQAVVAADPTEIHQVLLNLCTNAAQALTGQHGTIEIELNVAQVDAEFANQHLGLVAGPYLRLAVSDTGQGMTREVLDRIFEPFFTTKETGAGTGLGLSVVHGIVTSLGGAVSAYSEPGQGSAFRVYLPLKTAGPQALPSQPKALPTGSGHILLVDDEPMLIELCRRMLTQLGYSVSAFSVSEEALRAFRAAPQSFDLVLTDQTMPGLTGAEIAKEILALRPELPVILITGFSQLVTKERASALGIFAYLAKPLEMSELAQTIQRALTREA